MPELTLAQLAFELQVSTSKLSRMTRAGRIPCLRIGRAVRYELEPVKAALRVGVSHKGQGTRDKAQGGRLRRMPVRALRVVNPATEQWIVEERRRVKALCRADTAAEA